MAQGSNNYPLDLVARSIQGPPTIIRFVDEPCDTIPLSQLLDKQQPQMIIELPAYDDTGIFAEQSEWYPGTEMELPRFELPGLDPEGFVENTNEPTRGASTPAWQFSLATAVAAALLVTLTLFSASALALASKALLAP